jgi:hypothetical protein
MHSSKKYSWRHGQLFPAAQKLILELLIETGMRLGELLKLYAVRSSQHANVRISHRQHDRMTVHESLHPGQVELSAITQAQQAVGPVLL